MGILIGLGIVCAVVVVWAFVRGFRDGPGSITSPPRREYNCSCCGCSVSTEYNLDGQCEGCWDRHFSNASEMLDRED